MNQEIYLEYVDMDEEGVPLTAPKREYFPDADRMRARRGELEELMYRVVSVHAPEEPPAKTPLIF